MFFIFASYILYLGITTQNLFAKILFITVGLFVLGFSVYYEYLKSLYERMIRALTMDFDIPKAKHYRQQLITKDFMKGFKSSIILFDSLLLMDEGKYQETLDHMEENKKFFHSTVDYLFITYHNQLLCHYFLNQPTEAEIPLKRLFEIKQLKKKKYSPLFSWDEIAGVQYALANRHTKSIQAFEKVNTKQLNTREQAYLYYFMAQEYKKLSNNR